MTLTKTIPTGIDYAEISIQFHDISNAACARSSDLVPTQVEFGKLRIRLLEYFNEAVSTLIGNEIFGQIELRKVGIITLN